MESCFLIILNLRIQLEQGKYVGLTYQNINIWGSLSLLFNLFFLEIPTLFAHGKVLLLAPSDRFATNGIYTFKNTEC